MHTKEENDQYLHDLFEKYYENIRRAIYRVLYTYTRSGRDAEDLTQDVFCIAADNIEELHNHPTPDKWLYKTATFRCNNYLKVYFARQERLFGSLELHGQLDQNIEDLEAMMVLESKLSEKDFKLLSDYCIKRRPAEEISREQGITLASLRNKISAIRNKIPKIFIFLMIFLLASTYKNGAC